MSRSLSKLHPTLKSGDEPFHADRKRLELTLLDWWRWDASDLVSNTTRGRLAEFIVAMALRLDPKIIRNDWAEYDLKMPLGENRFLKIEVKSKAYVQTWDQKKLSEISFTVKKTKSLAKRVADVYVLALLAEKNKRKIDPTNVNQWQFWVLTSGELNKRGRSQHSITLNSLKTEFGSAVSFQRLRTKVLRKAVACKLK
jgi:hypothetical protein